MHQIHSAKFQTTARRWLPAMTLLAVLGAAAPLAAEPPSDLLEEVRTMLEAGMSEPIILKWLDGSDRKPRRPSAAELIGLQQAGASDELLARLLELAAAAQVVESDAVAEPSAASDPRAAAPGETAPATSPPNLERRHG